MSEDKCGCLHPIPLTTFNSAIPTETVPVGCSVLAACNEVHLRVWAHEVSDTNPLLGTFVTNNCSELKICFDIDASSFVCGKLNLILEAVIRGSEWCAEIEDEVPFFIEDRILCWNIAIPDDVDTTGCYSVYFNLRPSQGTITVFSAGYCCVRCGC